jgi:hypothetical protein
MHRLYEGEDARRYDVGRAVITNLIGTTGTIHFHCAADHATRFTCFHKPPGAEDFHCRPAPWCLGG